MFGHKLFKTWSDEEEPNESDEEESEEEDVNESTTSSSNEVEASSESSEDDLTKYVNLYKAGWDSSDNEDANSNGRIATNFINMPTLFNDEDEVELVDAKFDDTIFNQPSDDDIADYYNIMNTVDKLHFYSTPTHKSSLKWLKLGDNVSGQKVETNKANGTDAQPIVPPLDIQQLSNDIMKAIEKTNMEVKPGESIKIKDENDSEPYF